MRVYFEKPRTTVGLEGPDQRPQPRRLLRYRQGPARSPARVLLDINNLGLPAGCEFLDMTTPQYIADLVAWAAIGARTTESQIHRELASGLSCPVGFKNGTDGNVAHRARRRAVRLASRTISWRSPRAAARPLRPPPATTDCHIILRGGNTAELRRRERRRRRRGLPIKSGVDRRSS